MLNQKRVVIDYVSPSVNCGEFFIKRIVNEIINVRAHILADGHDVLGASVLTKHENDKDWKETRMALDFNDEWQSTFTVEKQGFYNYKVEAWIDYALNWRHGIIRKIDDGQYVTSELLEGAEYLKTIIKNITSKEDKAYLKELANIFTDESQYDKAVNEATSVRLYQIFYNNPIKLLENTS
jgi:starch synthase (maltosyl-transferring)